MYGFIKMNYNLIMKLNKTLYLSLLDKQNDKGIPIDYYHKSFTFKALIKDTNKYALSLKTNNINRTNFIAFIFDESYSSFSLLFALSKLHIPTILLDKNIPVNSLYYTIQKCETSYVFLPDTLFSNYKALLSDKDIPFKLYSSLDDLPLKKKLKIIKDKQIDYYNFPNSYYLKTKQHNNIVITPSLETQASFLHFECASLDNNFMVFSESKLLSINNQFLEDIVKNKKIYIDLPLCLPYAFSFALLTIFNDGTLLLKDDNLTNIKRSDVILISPSSFKNLYLSSKLIDKDLKGKKILLTSEKTEDIKELIYKIRKDVNYNISFIDLYSISEIYTFIGKKDIQESKFDIYSSNKIIIRDSLNLKTEVKTGNILISSPSMMYGYLQTDKMSQPFFKENATSYFISEDKGTIKDGFLALQPSSKDEYFKNNGYKLDFFTIESILNENITNIKAEIILDKISNTYKLKIITNSNDIDKLKIEIEEVLKSNIISYLLPSEIVFEKE